MCAGCVSGEVDNPDQYKDLLVQAVAVANTNLDEKVSKYCGLSIALHGGVWFWRLVVDKPVILCLSQKMNLKP